MPKADVPPPAKRKRHDHTPAMNQRDSEFHSRSPDPVRHDSSFDHVTPLSQLSLLQKFMWNRLGVNSVTDLSPFNPTCASGYVLSHVTLDSFLLGKAPVCNRCNSLCAGATSAHTCHQCVQSYWLSMPILKATQFVTAALSVSRLTVTSSAICHH